MSENSLLGKLNHLVTRFEEIGTLITDPDIISDMDRFIKLNKEYSDLQKIVDARNEYKEAVDAIAEAKYILENESDNDLRQLATEELSINSDKIPEMEEKIKILLIPADPEDAKNVIMEIRGGTGGDEAAIFAGDLYKMYTRYCESKGWQTELTSYTEGTSGGFKEVIFKVTGNDVYGTLKYESGVHRVQRVPQTETQGRVHTSASTVAVLPEAEETEIQIRPEDVRVDVMRAGGPGGQCVNTTDSAVRLTHIPTGIVVIQQDEKSQIKNKAKAWRVLRARLFDFEETKRNAERAAERKHMVGSGDRSERIRTYNFPQNRITDHRINLTLYKLDQVMQGQLDELVDALCIYNKEALLKADGSAFA